MNDFRGEYAKRYFYDIRKCIDQIENSSFLQKLSDIVDILLEARKEKRIIFIMGNGGSASTASHFASDLAKGTIVNGGERFRVVALTDNMPLLTAWANDEQYEDIFVEQLKNLLSEGDVVMGISCSGNSMNVIKALEYANESDAISVGFTGFDGGKLKDVARITFIVPCNNMQICEDIHLLLVHLLSSIIRAETSEKTSIVR